MNQEVIYSGELDRNLYDEVAEQVEGFPTEWIDANVDLMLSGDKELTVRGPETKSLLGGTYHATNTYDIDSTTADDLRDAFE